MLQILISLHQLAAKCVLHISSRMHQCMVCLCWQPIPTATHLWASFLYHSTIIFRFVEIMLTQGWLANWPHPHGKAYWLKWKWVHPNTCSTLQYCLMMIDWWLIVSGRTWHSEFLVLKWLSKQWRIVKDPVSFYLLGSLTSKASIQVVAMNCSVWSIFDHGSCLLGHTEAKLIADSNYRSLSRHLPIEKQV